MIQIYSSLRIILQNPLCSRKRSHDRPTGGATHPTRAVFSQLVQRIANHTATRLSFTASSWMHVNATVVRRASQRYQHTGRQPKKKIPFCPPLPADSIPSLVQSGSHAQSTTNEKAQHIPGYEWINEWLRELVRIHRLGICSTYRLTQGWLAWNVLRIPVLGEISESSAPEA